MVTAFVRKVVIFSGVCLLVMLVSVNISLPQSIMEHQDVPSVTERGEYVEMPVHILSPKSGEEEPYILVIHKEVLREISEYAHPKEKVVPE